MNSRMTLRLTINIQSHLFALLLDISFGSINAHLTAINLNKFELYNNYIICSFIACIIRKIVFLSNKMCFDNGVRCYCMHAYANE